MNKDDPEYWAKRAKNNEAIKRTRDKARVKAQETEAKIELLRDENRKMEQQISVLDKEKDFLQNMFKMHSEAQQKVNGEKEKMDEANNAFLDAYISQM